jgi:hypothetical protein
VLEITMTNKKQTNEGLAELAGAVDQDHEVQMARADLYKIAKYAIKLHELLKNVTEAEGLEGWQQAKITKAADYIGSVYHSLEYDQKVMTPESRKFRSTMSEAEKTNYKAVLEKSAAKLISDKLKKSRPSYRDPNAKNDKEEKELAKKLASKKK